MKKKILTTALMSVLLVNLSACTTFFRNDKLNREVKVVNEEQASKMSMTSDYFEAQKRAKNISAMPYISGKAIPKAKHTLPRAFYLTYSIGMDKNQSLASISGEITRLSGIPVRISADVTTKTASGGGNYATSVTQLTNDSWGTDAPVDYSNSTLADILNGVCSRLGVDWEYDEDGGTINISRLTTRVFYVPISVTSITQSATIGKAGSSGGSSGGNSSSTSSSSNSTVNSNIDPWTGMQSMITGMVTEKGRVTVNASMNTIVVTDVKQSVERIGKVIARFIKQNTQSLLFKIDVIGVVNKNQNDVGLDWSLVWNQLSTVAPNSSVVMNGNPNFVTTQPGGNLGFTLNPPAGGGSPGMWDGSKLMMSALNAVGKTSAVNSIFAPAMSNRLVSLALTDQLNYISSTTAVGSAVGGSAVGLNTATATTGFILNMVPLMTENRDIVLQFSMDVSTLNRVDVISSGGQTIQQPNISGTQMSLSPKLKEGSTTVLTGYSRMVNVDDSQTVLPDSMLVGGGYKTSRVKQDMVVLITPISID